MGQSEPEPQAEQKPILNIVGVKVALGPIHKGLLPLFSKWDNDFDVCLLSGDPLRPSTKEETETSYENYTKEDQRSRVQFAIYEQATLRPIGVTQLGHIRYKDRTRGIRHSDRRKGLLGQGLWY